jgi:hypothetical protein
VAWLTYPYHCCAFQFPATHHPEEFAEHEVSIAKEVISNKLTVTGIANWILCIPGNKVWLNIFFCKSGNTYMTQTKFNFPFSDGN